MTNNKPIIYPLGLKSYLLVIVPYILVALGFIIFTYMDNYFYLILFGTNCLIQLLLLRRTVSLRYYNGNRPRMVVGAQTIFLDNILYVRKNFLGLKVFYKDDFYNTTRNCTVWVKDRDLVIRTFNFKVE